MPVFIVAELSANHLGSLDRAIDLVDAAKEAGADAVKLQAYSASALTLDHDGPGFVIKSGPWAGRKLYDLYSEAETSPEIIEKLFAYCRAQDVACFSSVFDREGLKFLEGLDCPVYKIASFEANDLPLIRAAASRGKPMIVSTGMASDFEIAEVCEAAREASDLTLLHCVSSYPVRVEDANLHRIVELAERFCVKTGLSDHTLSTTLPAVAVALGATVIEKHLAMSRSDGGPDAEFSLEPDEFVIMVQAIREAEVALTVPKEKAEPYKHLRRSLYVVEDVEAGALLTQSNVRSIRPGYGLPPAMQVDVLGRPAAVALKRGTPLKLEHVG